MKIFVVRHGITKHNKEKIINGQRIDEPLEPEGIEQAKEARNKLPSTIIKIYASDMVRTRQTADILNEGLNVEISHHPELREIDFGIFSGKTWVEVEEEHGPGKHESYRSVAYDFNPYDGESVQDVKARINKLLSEIKEKYSDGEVLIVAHGGILRLLHHIYHGNQPDVIENASIHEFDI